MLDHQKKILTEKYIDNIVKLEPFLLRVSGYNAQETRLKIDNFFLHCTPGTFSLTNCKLLLFLGEKEMNFFKEYEEKLISLKLAFDSTYFGKPISFFLKGKMESITTIRDNVHTLDMELTSTSDTYKELFLHLSEITSIYKKVYHSKLSDQQKAGIKKVPITYTQIMKNNQVFCYGKLDNISPHHFEIFIDDTTTKLNLNEKYKFIVTYNGRSIPLNGTIVKHEASSYISTIELNMEYIHILTIYMNMQNQLNTKQEELEEL